MHFIFIDGSYFIFYKYHALKAWWNFAKDSEDALTDNPSDNEEFVMRFKKTFQDKVKEIAKKLKVKNPIYIVGKDCPRSDIWRTQSYSTYKDGRKNDSGIGPFFKMVYEDKMFEAAGVGAILEHPSLEADDCIAITVKYILEKYGPDDDVHIHIITSDMDYLQLASDNVHLYNMKFKNLQDSKQSYKDAEKDLFFKIVQGDKSDNIPSVFKTCGPKETLKCYEDREYFEAKLEKFSAYEKYAFNKRMIDFNEIPEELIKDFKEKILLSV